MEWENKNDRTVYTTNGAFSFFQLAKEKLKIGYTWSHSIFLLFLLIRKKEKDA